jgi:hypothetical protein
VDGEAAIMTTAVAAIISPACTNDLKRKNSMDALLRFCSSPPAIKNESAFAIQSKANALWQRTKPVRRQKIKR